MLDNERTELHVFVRIESRIVWVTESLSLGSDLGTNGKFLKQLFHRPRVNDGLNYEQQLKKLNSWSSCQ